MNVMVNVVIRDGVVKPRMAITNEAIVLELKSKIIDEIMIKVAQQNLIFDNNVLTNSRVIGDLSVEENDQFTLAILSLPNDPLFYINVLIASISYDE